MIITTRLEKSGYDPYAGPPLLMLTLSSLLRSVLAMTAIARIRSGVALDGQRP